MRDAFSQITSILGGGSGGREIGADTAGDAALTWQFMLMAGSMLLWCVLLAPACWAALRGRSIGRSRARYLPLALAASYPLLQLARFSPTAGEMSDRASTFVGMAMALVVGAWLAPRVHLFGRLLIPGMIVLLLGGAIVGSGPDWQRIPGPYLAGAEQRSVDAETVAVAEWAGEYLPAGSHVAADNTFSRLLPNFAPVVPVTGTAGYESVTPLYISEQVDDAALSLIRDNDIDFVVVDTRMIGQTVRSGTYFEGSGGYGAVAETLTAAQLDKFDGAPGFTKVLDGPVEVYDVRSIRGVASTFADRPAPGLPGDWTPWQVALTALLLGAGVVLRGRLLDPRRFRARDVWRPAVLVPAAMLLGVLGVLSVFPPLFGSAIAVLVLALLLLRTRAPEPYPAGPPSRGSLVWTGLTTVVLGLALGLAIWSAWHGLLDHAPLPAPLTAVSSSSEITS